MEKSDVCNFADDNTSFNCGQESSDIMRNLKHDTEIILKCLKLIS